MFKPGYYYLHANGQLIFEKKDEFKVHEYVIKHWLVESEKQYNSIKTQAKEIDNGTTYTGV
jgi:hypothetical protein